MKLIIVTLLIILIVVMIMQNVLFIYHYILDAEGKRQAANTTETLKNVQEDFLNEKKRFQNILAERDKTIKELLARLTPCSKNRNYEPDGLFGPVTCETKPTEEQQ